MSELTANNSQPSIYRQALLAGTALGLFASAFAVGEASAAENDSDRPTVWIELGTEMEHIGGQGDPFTPALIAQNSNSPVLQAVTPVQAQRPSPFAFAGQGSLSFQPNESNWKFSVGVSYGRSSNAKRVDHQTNRVFQGIDPLNTLITILTTVERFAETQVKHHESHTILDFSAGKDVGLGLFGRESSSTFGVGIRFAQFTSKESFDLRARPDLHIKYIPSATATQKIPIVSYNGYHALGDASRSFQGIGPSVSLSGSMVLLGEPRESDLTFDWSVNASVLFGRQKAHVTHQESAYHHSGVAKYNSSVYQHSVAGHSTDRSVVVPNAGAFAGASWRVRDFKVSLGYRADFFFGAMDVGIDETKSENVSFHGPFATVSLGLGG